MPISGLSIHGFYRKLVRVTLRAFQAARRAMWSITKPDAYGAHAIALTPAGKVILVKLSYAEGWHLPGGGRKAGENAEQNIVRELTEEIGMLAHDGLEDAYETTEGQDFRRDHASVFIARNVEYRPRRWSLEIEEVIEVDVDALPADLSRRARRWIWAFRDDIGLAD
jgi:8-oxo-dGTP pyrophosphatase MutT (NUDIX family)